MRRLFSRRPGYFWGQDEATSDILKITSSEFCLPAFVEKYTS